jgi:membrane-associated phospholipid phosphatase
VADANWLPLIVTPTFPEYPSAHSTASTAATAVLAFFFGEDPAFTVDSASMPGVERKFSSFPEATAEIANARVFAGIHFRSSCNDGAILGQQVGTYIIDHALLPASE